MLIHWFNENSVCESIKAMIKIIGQPQERNKNMLLRWYLTLQGDNSLKSVERFDHMTFVCRFQASLRSKPQREKLLCG